MGSQAFFSILKLIITICLASLMLSCGGNLYEATSSKTSREAIIEDISSLTNSLKFSEAILLIEQNPTLIPTREDKLLFASAYAGSCGLTFATIFESLATATGSPMEFAKNAFTTRDIIPGNCFKAQQWIETIGVNSVRNTNENIAMFLIGLAKIGTYLRNRADTDKNGLLDAGYNSCSAVSLPTDEVKQIITGFGLMIQNATSIGTNISPGLSASITNVSAACTALGLSCSQTDPTLVPDADAASFRDAIKSDKVLDLGIESCTPASPACCP